MGIITDERAKKVIEKVKSAIKSTCFENSVYLVGGAIRDSLLGMPVHDLDFVVEYPNGGIIVANLLATKEKCFAFNTNPVIFETYGTAKVTLFKDEDLKNLDIEFVQSRKEQYHKESRKPDTAYGTIQEYAARRVLTINALYYNISTEKLFDFTNKGCSDLCNQVIRTPSDPDIIFSDDPLRMLRVIRFSNKLGWGIEKDTWLGIIKNVGRIDIVSQERISDEISKILLCKKPSVGIRKLYYSGLLDRIMPDIYDLNLAYESRNPVVTSFDHTMNVLDYTQPYIESRLAALFHDVGKVLTDKDRTMSPDQFSAEIAAADLKLMKFPNHIVKSVETAIKYHRLFKIYADGVTPPDKKIRKFVNMCGDDIGTVVDLMNANNNNTTFDKKKRQVLDILNRIEELEELDKMTNIKLPINGKDIQQYFSIKPSPIVGILLETVKDAYFENPNITKDECFKIVENKIKSLV